jgi:CheY-like chemotaxis protein
MGESGEFSVEPCVLVVCNEKELTIIPQALLSDGLSVQVAHNAPEAVERIMVRKPDLIILDMMLPRISGITLLQTMRKSPTMRELPVILTAARTSSASRIEALDAGADAFMSKPVTEKDLLHLVHEFLPSQSQYPAS